VLRIAAVLLVERHPAVDDAWYLETARGIAAGQGYLHLGKPTAYFPVGYPAILALVFRVAGASLQSAQLLNVVLSLATVVCTFSIARALGGSDRTATLAAALLAFMPNQVLSCCVSMSEITFTFLMTLGIALSLRRDWGRANLWGVLVGVTFGWATLVRPQGLVVPFFVVPLVGLFRHGWPLLDRRSLGRLAALSVGLAVVVAPWTYRNYRVFDAVVLVSTNGGDNLLIGNNPTSTQHCADPLALFPPDVDVTHMSELARDRLGSSIAKSYLLHHPFEALSRVPKKIWYMYRSDLGVTNWLWEDAGKTGTPLYFVCQGVTQAFYLLVLAGALAWLVRKGLAYRTLASDERLLLLVVASVAGYFTLITAVFFGDSRYHAPLMPLFAVAASALAMKRLETEPSPEGTPEPREAHAAAS
jgi:4-amino-4-deoxy-L-arabinose transferase-like glycosyltransferase